MCEQSVRAISCVCVCALQYQYSTRTGLPLSFNTPITTDYWDDDGSPEFTAMLQRIVAEGAVLLKSSTATIGQAKL